MSAVGLPVLGVVAVTLAGGLDRLASRVHPGFAFVYILILYLAIGPCLAIPRTASTSFSMAVIPFFPGENSIAVVQFIYSLVFFAAASVIAMHPEKLTEYLGKRLTPVLLVLIVVLFAAAALNPAGEAAALWRFTEAARLSRICRRISDNGYSCSSELRHDRGNEYPGPGYH